jgi:flavorubredoxin
LTPQAGISFSRESPLPLTKGKTVVNLQTQPSALRPVLPRGRSTIDKNHIEPLADGQLYALQNVIELDGRVSSYPANARGYTVSNCYLLIQGRHALLLDSGLSAHENSIISMIRSLTTPDTLLSVFPLRINEYMSVCNIEAIAQNFNVEQCYSGNPDAALWVDFGRRSDSNDSRPYSLKTTLVSRAETLHVGRTKRPIDVFQAPIRLINTRWMYDQETRTLFTSDSFTHEWSDSSDGPWTMTEADNTTTSDHVRSFLLNTRYWWLEGGKTTELRRKLAAIFEKYPIETIAPGYGRILRGRALVERQYTMFDEVLGRLNESAVAAKYVDRDELR